MGGCQKPDPEDAQTILVRDHRAMAGSCLLFSTLHLMQTLLDNFD
jgi:hypothetical protein